MARILVLYGIPQDASAFDRYYAETHVPIVQRMPGLRRYEVSQGTVSTPAGPASLHLVATLTFDTLADAQAALASPEGQAAAGDLPNFADGGVDLYLFEDRAV